MLQVMISLFRVYTYDNYTLLTLIQILNFNPEPIVFKFVKSHGELKIDDVDGKL